jgi:hypothetical protein
MRFLMNFDYLVKIIFSYHLGVHRHPLRSYLDYVGYLYQRMDPLPEQERFEVACSLSLSLLCTENGSKSFPVIVLS